jgi:hypothetical protein
MKDPPREVVAAISVMAVGVFITNVLRTLSVVTGVLSGRIAGADVAFKIIDEFVIWGFSIGLLALIWYGVNWARWLNLVLATLNVAMMIYLATTAVVSQRYVQTIIPFADVVLEVVALYLLFLSPGRVWFEKGSTATAA